MSCSQSVALAEDEDLSGAIFVVRSIASKRCPKCLYPKKWWELSSHFQTSEVISQRNDFLSDAISQYSALVHRGN